MFIFLLFEAINEKQIQIMGINQMKKMRRYGKELIMNILSFFLLDTSEIIFVILQQLK